jgi:hypothetical protein
MLAVRRLTAGDIPAAVAIVRGLPDYFTDDVPGKVESDAAIHAGWVLADSGEVAGFAVAARKSAAGAMAAGQPGRHLHSRPSVDPLSAIRAQER